MTDHGKEQCGWKRGLNSEWNKMKGKEENVEKGESRHYLLLITDEPSPSGHPRGVLASTRSPVILVTAWWRYGRSIDEVHASLISITETWLYSNFILKNVGSLYVSGKLPTYPSLKPIFCRNQCSEKYTVSVNVGLGEGYVGSRFPETYNDPKHAFLVHNQLSPTISHLRTVCSFIIFLR